MDFTHARVWKEGKNPSNESHLGQQNTTGIVHQRHGFNWLQLKPVRRQVSDQTSPLPCSPFVTFSKVATGDIYVVVTSGIALGVSVLKIWMCGCMMVKCTDDWWNRALMIVESNPPESRFIYHIRWMIATSRFHNQNATLLFFPMPTNHSKIWVFSNASKLMIWKSIEILWLKIVGVLVFRQCFKRHFLEGLDFCCGCDRFFNYWGWGNDCCDVELVDTSFEHYSLSSYGLAGATGYGWDMADMIGWESVDNQIS